MQQTFDLWTLFIHLSSSSAVSIELLGSQFLLCYNSWKIDCQSCSLFAGAMRGVKIFEKARLFSGSYLNLLVTSFLRHLFVWKIPISSKKMFVIWSSTHQVLTKTMHCMPLFYGFYKISRVKIKFDLTKMAQSVSVTGLMVACVLLLHSNFADECFADYQN